MTPLSFLFFAIVFFFLNLKPATGGKISVKSGMLHQNPSTSLQDIMDLFHTVTLSLFSQVTAPTMWIEVVLSLQPDRLLALDIGDVVKATVDAGRSTVLLVLHSEWKLSCGADWSVASSPVLRFGWAPAGQRLEGLTLKGTEQIGLDIKPQVRANLFSVSRTTYRERQ